MDDERSGPSLSDMVVERRGGDDGGCTGCGEATGGFFGGAEGNYNMLMIGLAVALVLLVLYFIYKKSKDDEKPANGAAGAADSKAGFRHRKRY